MTHLVRAEDSEYGAAVPQPVRQKLRLGERNGLSTEVVEKALVAITTNDRGRYEC
jgi:hypothetical protein